MTMVEIVAGPVSSGMVSGTTAMLSPASTFVSPAVTSSLRPSAGWALSICSEEIKEQHAAAHLERGQRDAEELDDADARQRAHRDDAERTEGGHTNGARTLFGTETLREMDEERDNPYRIDDGQQRDQRFEQVHGAMLGPARARGRWRVAARCQPENNTFSLDTVRSFAQFTYIPQPVHGRGAFA